MPQWIVRYALILLSTLFILFSLPPTHSIHTLNPTGRVEVIEGLRILHLQGNHYEMGLQQGLLCRDELRQLVRSYLYDHLILEQGVAHFWLLAYALLVERQVPKDLREEMQGIVDATGLSYRDVLLLNTIPDHLALAYQLPSWESFPLRFSPTSQDNTIRTISPGMSFSAWGKATINGELLLGHNRDSIESNLLSPYLLVVVRQPTSGNAFVSVGIMGMVGVWTGMNEEKIAVALSSAPTADIATNGQPLPFLLRRVLQAAGSLDEAINTILASPRLTGGNVLLGDGKGPRAVALELSPHRYAIFEVEAEHGLLARTDHFLRPELSLLQQERLSAQEEQTSRIRLEQIRHQLEWNHGWLGAEKALAFLEKDKDIISKHAQESDVASLYSTLFCPGRLTFWIAPSVTASKSYIQLNVKEALLGHSQAYY